MLKHKPRADGAAYKHPAASGLGGLPRPCRDDELGPVPRGNVGTQAMRRRFVLMHEHGQGCAGVPVPDLDTVQPMPMGPLSGFQQKIDRRPRRAWLSAFAPSLLVPATLRMGQKAKRFYYFPGVHVVQVTLSQDPRLCSAPIHRSVRFGMIPLDSSRGKMTLQAIFPQPQSEGLFIGLLQGRTGQVGCSETSGLRNTGAGFEELLKRAFWSRGASIRSRARVWSIRP